MDSNKVSCTINGSAIEFSVRKAITLGSVEEIVNRLVNSVFENGEYKPCRKEFMYRFLLLANYTDFDYKPYSVEEMFILLCCNPTFYDAFSSGIIEEQRRLILDSANELIELKLHESPLNKIGNSVNDLIVAITGVVEKIDNDNVKELFNELANSEEGKNFIKLIGSIKK